MSQIESLPRCLSIIRANLFTAASKNRHFVKVAQKGLVPPSTGHSGQQQITRLHMNMTNALRKHSTREAVCDLELAI